MASPCSERSIWFKTAFVFVIIALVLQSIGISLPYFMKATVSRWETSNHGLWKSCTTNRQYESTVCEDSIFADSGWLLPAKLLQCVGLAMTVLTIIISLTLLLGIAAERLARANRITCFIALCMVAPGTITTIRMLLNTPVTEHFQETELGESFYLCIGAACSLLIAYLLLLVDDRKSNT